MARAMSQIKKADDTDVNLLSALKPFLNKKRQKICGDCTRILKMKKVFEFMNEHGEDFNF